MRVVSGKYGSRNLKPVPGSHTRPTTDKVKESMFSLLGGFFAGGTCLDVYAGSGALAIEAVSRGIEHAVLCEKYRPALQTIDTNIRMTKEEERFEILKGDYRKTLVQYLNNNQGTVFSLVFLDPPYQKQTILKDIEWLLELGCINHSTLIVCETDSNINLPQTMQIYHKSKNKKYGQIQVDIYEGKEDI